MFSPYILCLDQVFSPALLSHFSVPTCLYPSAPSTLSFLFSCSVFYYSPCPFLTESFHVQFVVSVSTHTFPHKYSHVKIRLESSCKKGCVIFIFLILGCLTQCNIFTSSIYLPVNFIFLKIWIKFHCVYKPYFYYPPSVDGHQGWVHSLAYVNRAAWIWISRNFIEGKMPP